MSARHSPGPTIASATPAPNCSGGSARTRDRTSARRPRPAWLAGPCRRPGRSWPSSPMPTSSRKAPTAGILSTPCCAPTRPKEPGRAARPEGEGMTVPTGRREASKQATRTALQAAALRLFAERGYVATTVADIARAANVTHRTFYRYFDGKDGLLADQYLTWLAALRSEIAGRPAGEPPMTTVWQAKLSVSS